MRKLRPRAGAGVEVEQSLEPLFWVRSGGQGHTQASGALAALNFLALSAPPMSRHLLQVPAEGRPAGPDRSNRGLPRGALRGLEVAGVGRDRVTMTGYAKPGGSKGSVPPGERLWFLLQKPCDVPVAPCGFLASQLG